MKNEVPFEGVLGNTSELRLLQFLISLPKLDFNISELSRVSGVTRPPVDKVVKKFAEWGVVEVLPRRGNMTFYRLNEESSIVATIVDFNNALIEEMYPEAKGVSAVERSVVQVTPANASGTSCDWGMGQSWPLWREESSRRIEDTSGVPAVVFAKDGLYRSEVDRCVCR